MNVGSVKNPPGSRPWIPVEVVSALEDFVGLLVGSAAAYVDGRMHSPDNPQYFGSPNDWDVIVPPDRWAAFARTGILRDSHMNNFGGYTLRMQDDNVMDVWPATLDSYFVGVGTKTPRFALRLHPYVFLQRINDR